MFPQNDSFVEFSSWTSAGDDILLENPLVLRVEGDEHLFMLASDSIVPRDSSFVLQCSVFLIFGCFFREHMG